MNHLTWNDKNSLDYIKANINFDDEHGFVLNLESKSGDNVNTNQTHQHFLPIQVSLKSHRSHAVFNGKKLLVYKNDDLVKSTKPMHTVNLKSDNNGTGTPTWQIVLFTILSILLLSGVVFFVMYRRRR